MKCDTTIVLPRIFNNTDEEKARAYFNFCLNSVNKSTMSVGVHVGAKKSGRNSATWPKMKKIITNQEEDPDRYHPRPQTATLERPRILNIALIGKIDMSLTRKHLLTISNLCLAPIQKPDPRETKRNGSSIQNGRGGKTRKYNVSRKAVSDTERPRASKGQSRKISEKYDDRWEDEDSSVSEVSKSKRSPKPKSPKIPALVKELVNGKRSPVPVHNSNNNNSDVEDNSKSCRRPVVIKKGAVGKKMDDVFGGLKASVEVPAPCTTCGRPEQPERLHSHPAPSASRPNTMRGASPEVAAAASPKTNRSASVKSSVRKPMPIKFRSGKSNRKDAESSPVKVVDPPRVKSAEKMPKSKSPQPAKVAVTRSGPRVVVCYLCGREFGTASLPLHEPHCLQRWQRENSQLPAHQQRPVPQKPDKPLNTEEWNKFAWEASQAHLVPCNNCGRTFNPDRLEVHQRSCKPGARRVNFPNQKTIDVPGSSANEAEVRATSGRSSGGVRNPPTVYCYICGRRFGTASIGIHEPQCLEKWRAENSKLPPGQQRPEPIKPSGQCRPVSSPPPENTPAPSPPAPPEAAKGPRRRAVHCYLCGRQFGTASINIHEKQCLKKWRIENNKLPPSKRRPEPEKPDIVFTETGEIDYQGTMDAIWQSHLDQLVPCAQCGRTFNPDRLEVHARSCKGSKR